MNTLVGVADTQAASYGQALGSGGQKVDTSNAFSMLMNGLLASSTSSIGSMSPPGGGFGMEALQGMNQTGMMGGMGGTTDAGGINQVLLMLCLLLLSKKDKGEGEGDTSSDILQMLLGAMGSGQSGSAPLEYAKANEAYKSLYNAPSLAKASAPTVAPQDPYASAGPIAEDVSIAGRDGAKAQDAPPLQAEPKNTVETSPVEADGVLGDEELSKVVGGGARRGVTKLQHAADMALAAANNVTIPTKNMKTAAALTSSVKLASMPGNRSPQLYRSVIDQFDVENNRRYAVNKKGTGDTYCNIFAWDVTKAMNAEVPHYINPDTGKPVVEGEIDNYKAMNANSMNKWLKEYGPTYGWIKATPEQAQTYANMGHPAVTSWYNPNGHGHMQVVSPSEDGAYDEKRGVAIAQAGRLLRNYTYTTKIYGKTLKSLDYFVHI